MTDKKPERNFNCWTRPAAEAKFWSAVFVERMDVIAELAEMAEAGLATSVRGLLAQLWALQMASASELSSRPPTEGAQPPRVQRLLRSFSRIFLGGVLAPERVSGRDPELLEFFRGLHIWVRKHHLPEWCALMAATDLHLWTGAEQIPTELSEACLKSGVPVSLVPPEALHGTVPEYEELVERLRHAFDAVWEPQRPVLLGLAEWDLHTSQPLAPALLEMQDEVLDAVRAFAREQRERIKSGELHECSPAVFRWLVMRVVPPAPSCQRIRQECLHRPGSNSVPSAKVIGARTNSLADFLGIRIPVTTGRPRKRSSAH